MNQGLSEADQSRSLNGPNRADWKIVLLSMALFALIAVLSTAIPAPIYRSTGTLIIPMGELNGTLIAAGTAPPLGVLKGIASSQTTLLKLEKDFKIPIKELKETVSADIDFPKNQLKISVMNNDAKKSNQMVSAVFKEISGLNRLVNFNLGNQQADLLGITIDAKSQERIQLTDELVGVQSNSKTVVDVNNLSTSFFYAKNLRISRSRLKTLDRLIGLEEVRLKQQGKAKMLSQNDIGSSLINDKLNETEQDYRRGLKRYGPENPQLLRLKASYDKALFAFSVRLKDKMIEASTGASAELVKLSSERIVLERQVGLWEELAASAPTDSLAIMRLNNQISTLDRVIKGLQVKYEEVKLASELDRVRWSQLGPVKTHQYPVNKDFSMNMFVGLIVGFFFGVVLNALRAK